ncbi:MAG: adenylyltransferase/cytidyltransferase family protein [Candidatus Aenigmatarchaeota archaeon]|nr:MAG: adenylyltransferase/cytidyltransferase family protein [Candidatus Aenigmarchaeota archaeon]
MKKVLVGGIFSVLHPGHMFFLKKAKSLGDFLIVVVSSDRTALKKNGVLLRTARERKLRVEKTGIADRVIIGDDEDRFRVVEKEKPDIIALGYDQRIDGGFRKRIKESGLNCKMVRIKEKFKDYSSSKFLRDKKRKRA